MSPDHVTRRLMSAVETMREACDEAERKARDGDALAVRGVLHSLSWGFADASFSIESAMAALEDAGIAAAVQGAQQEPTP